MDNAKKRRLLKRYFRNHIEDLKSMFETELLTAHNMCSKSCPVPISDSDLLEALGDAILDAAQDLYLAEKTAKKEAREAREA